MKRHFVDMPESFSRLPVDSRGFPVPKFVQWFSDDGKHTPTEPGDGVPDFRVVDSRHMAKAVNHDLCWLCGGKLGRFKAFVLGPMCAVNRVNSEPPSHYVCAKFAARNCPFLTQPRMRRNERELPPEHIPAVGLPIGRNPGVCGIWITGWYKPFKVDDGVLFRLGPPDRIEFWCEGRPATYDEVRKSVDSGLPLLRETAATHDGPEGVEELERQIKVFNKLLTAANLPRSAAA